jgi:pimeloyl-ACP methyl ester carboxylesterase
MAVVTFLPCHITSRGSPAFTETNFISADPFHARFRLQIVTATNHSQSDYFSLAEKRAMRRVDSLMPPRTKSRAAKPAQVPQSRFANVNGVRIHYLVAGKGDPVVLLHGYAETSHMWRPLMPRLANTHTVIAPDLRGAGQSSKPPDGYTKAAMARDIRAVARKLGYERIRIAGHDIGLMVAYAYAAQYPNEVDRIVLMDAFLPGVGNWRDVWLMRDLWHFHFYGKTPLALVHGRERIYFEHFWNDFAADPKHSVPERDRRFYAKEYARPGGMRAGFEYFRAFEQDANDFAHFAETPLPMPMLVLTGEKASGEFLIQQCRLVAANVEGVVIRNSGHWLMEEALGQVIPALVEFLNR